MKNLSTITALPQTGMRKMFDLAATMDDVVSFALGEPNFG